MDGPLQQVLLWGRLRDDQSPASLGSPSPGANSYVTWSLAGDPASLFWTSVFPPVKWGSESLPCKVIVKGSAS